MSKLIVLSGVPGSGKSFFSKLLREAKGGHVYVVSSDELRDLACGSPQIFTKEKEIWTMFYELPKVYSVDKEALVILDATQTIKKFRTDVLIDKKLKDYFDEVDLVVFNLDKEIVKIQNKNRDWPVPQEVLERFFNEFTLPNEEEIGFFKKVFYIRESLDFQDVINQI